LAVRCNVQKYRPSSSVKVKGQRSRSPEQKTKSAAFCWGRSSRARSSASSTPVGKSAHAVYSCLFHSFIHLSSRNVQIAWRRQRERNARKYTRVLSTYLRCGGSGCCWCHEVDPRCSTASKHVCTTVLCNEQQQQQQQQ